MGVGLINYADLKDQISVVNAYLKQNNSKIRMSYYSSDDIAMYLVSSVEITDGIIGRMMK